MLLQLISLAIGVEDNRRHIAHQGKVGVGLAVIIMQAQAGVDQQVQEAPVAAPALLRGMRVLDLVPRHVDSIVWRHMVYKLKFITLCTS